MEKKIYFNVSYGEELMHKKRKYIFNISYGEVNMFLI